MGVLAIVRRRLSVEAESRKPERVGGVSRPSKISMCLLITLPTYSCSKLSLVRHTLSRASLAYLLICPIWNLDKLCFCLKPLFASCLPYPYLHLVALRPTRGIPRPLPSCLSTVTLQMWARSLQRSSMSMGYRLSTRTRNSSSRPYPYLGSARTDQM